MNETDNDVQSQEPKISRLSIWVAIITIITAVVITLCVTLQILAVETLLIVAAISLPAVFFCRLLYEFIRIFVKK